MTHNYLILILVTFQFLAMLSGNFAFAESTEKPAVSTSHAKVIEVVCRHKHENRNTGENHEEVWKNFITHSGDLNLLLEDASLSMFNRSKEKFLSYEHVPNKSGKLLSANITGVIQNGVLTLKFPSSIKFNSDIISISCFKLFDDGKTEQINNAFLLNQIIYHKYGYYFETNKSLANTENEQKELQKAYGGCYAKFTKINYSEDDDKEDVDANENKRLENIVSCMKTVKITNDTATKLKPKLDSTAETSELKFTPLDINTNGENYIHPLNSRDLSFSIR